MVGNFLKYAYVNLPAHLMLELARVLSLLITRVKPDYFKLVVGFLMKVFNPKIAFEMQLNNTFKHLSSAYRASIKSLIAE